MKINLKFWIVISLASIAIIYFNSYNIVKAKPYIFSRTFGNNYVNKQTQTSKVPSSDYFYITDSLITSIKILNKNSDSIKYLVRSYEHKNEIIKDSFEVNLSGILEFLSDGLLYVNDNFLLRQYKKGRYSNVIKNYNFKTFKAYGLKRDSNTIALFGEHFVDDKYITGFFTFDIKNNKLEQIFALETEKKASTSKNFLTYSGHFEVSDNGLIYICDKMSIVYLIDPYSKVLVTIKTKENVPQPELIETDQGLFYKRGSTFSTNIGGTVFDKYYISLSYRIDQKDKLIFDYYNLNSGEYEKSRELNYKDFVNGDIISLSKYSTDSILLNTQHTVFKLSLK